MFPVHYRRKGHRRWLRSGKGQEKLGAHGTSSNSDAIDVSDGTQKSLVVTVWIFELSQTTACMNYCVGRVPLSVVIAFTAYLNSPYGAEV